MLKTMYPTRTLLPLFLLCFEPFSWAKPTPLNAILDEKPVLTKRGRKSKKIAANVPEEYLLWSQAKVLIEKPATLPDVLPKIQAVEKAILLSKLNSANKPLEKELEELFFALQLSKGVAFGKAHRDSAIQSFQRGLTGLMTFRWIYYWREENSKVLAKICISKKKKDEECLALARRVVDAFPKTANETKVLRELPLPDAVVYADFSGERLNQTYSEKKEKDEDDFQDVLDSYLQGKVSDFLKLSREFLTTYPKSSLRFRVNFLLAETLARSSNKKEANSIYQSLMDQVPLSYYSIVSAERLGVDLQTRLKKEPIQIDPETFTLNSSEQASLTRALNLMRAKKSEELGIELESFTRTKNYSNDFILYLMKIATDGKQNLVAFRLANELIQRKYPLMATSEMLEMLVPEVWMNEIQVEATAAHLDPLLVTSLIKQESGFKPTVVSSSGALGLMQLMPFTAVDTQKDLRLFTLKDPKINISVGVKYFQSLMEKYEGNPAFSLAAYNAGPHRVMKWRKEAGLGWGMIDWIEAIPFKETREYVTSILRNRYWYQVRKGLPVSKITELKGLTALPSVDKN